MFATRRRRTAVSRGDRRRIQCEAARAENMSPLSGNHIPSDRSSGGLRPPAYQVRRKKCPADGSFGVAQSPKSSAGGTEELYILQNTRQEKNHNCYFSLDSP